MNIITQSTPPRINKFAVDTTPRLALIANEATGVAAQAAALKMAPTLAR